MLSMIDLRIFSAKVVASWKIVEGWVRGGGGGGVTCTTMTKWVNKLNSTGQILDPSQFRFDRL